VGGVLEVVLKVGQVDLRKRLWVKWIPVVEAIAGRSVAQWSVVGRYHQQKNVSDVVTMRDVEVLLACGARGRYTYLGTTDSTPEHITCMKHYSRD
jgi:hypothetical protein